MKPSIKRTTTTSKTTGRRYVLLRSSNREPAQKYYLCSRPDCDAHLTCESDLFCAAHSQDKNSENEDITDISKASDSVNNDEFHDSMEDMEKESGDEEQETTNLDSTDDNVQNQNDSLDSTMEYDDKDKINDVNTSLPLSSRQRAKANRRIEMDEATGRRSFLDNSGRRRYLCEVLDCTNMLKCQTDTYCRTHEIHGSTTTIAEVNKNRGKQKRFSAPPLSLEKKEHSTAPIPKKHKTTIKKNVTNGHHSEEYDSPEKSQTLPTTNRPFRDASGKIRFLCANTSCRSQLPRKSEVFCKRHQPHVEKKESDKDTKPDHIPSKKADDNNVQQIDMNHNNTDTPSELFAKKRRYESSTPIVKPLTLSSIPAKNIVISTTSLPAQQWNNVITFLRQFPQTRLATNLNVNNSTTHLLIDDSENNLHCIITKKIVQAAVRRHVFIISSRWITECIRLNEFIDEHPFEIVSDSHTILRLSAQDFQINTKYLFDNPSSKIAYGFAVECRQCQGSINRNELIELIDLTGAKLYNNNDNSIDVLIVLCDTNEKNLNRIKEKYANTKVSNIKYVISDFLLKSIIKFEIQDADKYALQ